MTSLKASEWQYCSSSQWAVCGPCYPSQPLSLLDLSLLIALGSNQLIPHSLKHLEGGGKKANLSCFSGLVLS